MSKSRIALFASLTAPGCASPAGVAGWDSRLCAAALPLVLVADRLPIRPVAG